MQGGTIFYMYAADYSEKESWIGALGKAMIKPSVMIDDNFDNDYMWGVSDFRMKKQHSNIQSVLCGHIIHC